jgi:hypothetical protein
MAAIVKQRKDLSVHIRFLGGFSSWAFCPAANPNPVLIVTLMCSETSFSN